MLCDEVGLGKTVEAGLILSELVMRGLVRSVLVLTPPSLTTQWQGEMRRKFAVELTSQDDPAFRKADRDGWATHDRMIVSIHTAKREPHRSAILARNWDIVIVDEAHHLRNRHTAAWKFASEIRKQFILLLTATPVQNNLEELFNLVTLLEPGLLSTQRDFSRRAACRDWRRNRPSSIFAATRGSFSAPNRGARAAISSSPTACATTTFRGTR